MSIDDFIDGQAACVAGEKHTGTESPDWVRGYEFEYWCGERQKARSLQDLWNAVPERVEQ